MQSNDNVFYDGLRNGEGNVGSKTSFTSLMSLLFFDRLISDIITSIVLQKILVSEAKSVFEGRLVVPAYVS